jgi:hypothetical protein
MKQLAGAERETSRKKEKGKEQKSIREGKRNEKIER